MGVAEAVIVVIYLMALGYLGYLGYRNTQTSADYLVAGRKAHPVVMALSYGATFISTSAIVGFGGVAGMFGMGLLWLAVLNISVGIFVAFVFLGGPTRKMGHRLNAHTFPELLGKRYGSRFMQVFAGVVIFIFMPLYATAVMNGGIEFISAHFHISFNLALFIFAVIIGAYVLAGGLKGVMYNDALQGGIMFTGMLLLLILTYAKLGGPISAHASLTEMAPLVPANMQAAGHTGWTSFPTFNSPYWWVVVSSLVLGVGIGVLAQPQMAVRFMTVKSKRELNRAVAIGGVFILFMTGVAFTIGPLTNIWFHRHEEIRGSIQNREEVQSFLAMSGEERAELATRPTVVIVPSIGSADAMIVQRIPITPATEIEIGMEGEPDIVRPRMIAIARAGGNPDEIMPRFISGALPRWFSIVLLLTLLSAAMSTLSSQFHAMGTSIGRDVFEQIRPSSEGPDRRAIVTTRIGIVVGLVIVILMANHMRGLIAIATALFFGLCAAAFLPAFVGGLFWKRMNAQGAIASMVGGFAISFLWMLFVYGRTVGAFKLVGAPVLGPSWAVVDPIVVALPISAILAVVVTLLTPKMSDDHLASCFGGEEKASTVTVQTGEKVGA